MRASSSPPASSAQRSVTSTPVARATPRARRRRCGPRARSQARSRPARPRPGRRASPACRARGAAASVTATSRPPAVRTRVTPPSGSCATTRPGQQVLDPGLLGLARAGGRPEQRRRRARGLDAPVAQQQRVACDGERLADVVGDVEAGQRPLVAHAQQPGQHALPQAHVERGERLVEQQQARPGGERAGERDALPLAAGERAGAAAEQRPELERVDRGVDGRGGRRARRSGRCPRRSGAGRAPRPAARSRRAGAPGRARRRARCRAAVSPADRDPPARAGRRPAIASSSDVLPAPDGPITAVTPAGSVAHTRSSKRGSGSVRSISTAAVTGSPPGRAGLRGPRRESHSADHSAANASATVQPASTTARSSRPACASWKMASASVCVRPGMLPATRIVAPNSPSAREKASTAPARTPRQASGSVTRKKADTGPQPSVRARPTSRGSTSSNAVRAERTSSGNDITAVARTTAFQVKTTSTPWRGEPAAERAVAAEQLEQREADRGRRQHERQRQQRVECAAPGPAVAGEQKRRGDARHEHQSVAVAAICRVKTTTRRSSAGTRYVRRQRLEAEPLEDGARLGRAQVLEEGAGGGPGAGEERRRRRRCAAPRPPAPRSATRTRVESAASVA